MCVIHCLCDMCANGNMQLTPHSAFKSVAVWLQPGSRCGDSHVVPVVSHRHTRTHTDQITQLRHTQSSYRTLWVHRDNHGLGLDGYDKMIQLRDLVKSDLLMFTFLAWKHLTELDFSSVEKPFTKQPCKLGHWSILFHSCNTSLYLD